MTWFHGKNWTAIEAVYKVVPPVGMALVTCGGPKMDSPETILLLRRNYPACFLEDSTEFSRPVPLWVLVLTTQVFGGALYPAKEDTWCIPSIESLLEVGVFDAKVARDAGITVYQLSSEEDMLEADEVPPADHVTVEHRQFVAVCGELAANRKSTHDFVKGPVVVDGKKFWVFEQEVRHGNESFCCGKLSAVVEDDVAF